MVYFLSQNPKKMEYFLNEKKTEIIFHNDFSIVFPKEIKKVFLFDKKVYQLFENKLGKIIDEASFFIAASEKNKSLTEVRKIYNFFKKHNVNRSTVIIGIGGGITTDIAAFAASTFKRGCRLQLIPTTFLGMIDAAVGGKTAVNFNGIKNNIGTFYPAEKVIVNTRFLDTLPKKEMLNGWAECIKIALIKPSNLYDILILKNWKITSEILKLAIDLKLSICEKDLTDSKERRKLNLGHTFGHVLESISDYQISHGEAVAVGIRVVAYISNKLGYLNKNDLGKINNLLNLYDLPIRISASYINKLKKHGLNILLKDKKATSKLNIILFEGFQKTFIKQVDKPKEILELFIQYLSKVN
jgi:3-dehydroquinate synthase